MKLFAMVLFFLYISCNTMFLQASERETEFVCSLDQFDKISLSAIEIDAQQSLHLKTQKYCKLIQQEGCNQLLEKHIGVIKEAMDILNIADVTLEDCTLEDHQNFMDMHLDLIKEAELATQKIYSWMTYNQKGILCAANDFTTINIYWNDIDKSVLQKIMRVPALNFYGLTIPRKQNQQADKRLLSQLSQAIKSKCIKYSDTIVKQTTKLKTVTFDDFPIEDERNLNRICRYDVSSAYNETFSEDNHACIVAHTKDPFIKDKCLYHVYKRDAPPIQSKEIRNALKGNSICYEDTKDCIIEGEKYHRNLVSLDDQLALAQEELKVQEEVQQALDNAIYKNIMPTIPFFTNKLICSAHFQCIAVKSEVESLQQQIAKRNAAHQL